MRRERKRKGVKEQILPWGRHGIPFGQYRLQNVETFYLIPIIIYCNYMYHT